MWNLCTGNWTSWKLQPRSPKRRSYYRWNQGHKSGRLVLLNLLLLWYLHHFVIRARNNTHGKHMPRSKSSVGRHASEMVWSPRRSSQASLQCSSISIRTREHVCPHGPRHTGAWHVVHSARTAIFETGIVESNTRSQTRRRTVQGITGSQWKSQKCTRRFFVNRGECDLCFEMTMLSTDIHFYIGQIKSLGAKLHRVLWDDKRADQHSGRKFRQNDL